ncbi:MAG TPA: dethiobiotin synthase [Thermoleophilaceae bacterium]|nr:dethiobiotin synthase [Thermoleophilaceae bacterium]
MRGIFVTGTDTGVGKSVVAAAVCAALTGRGETVAAFKPVVTGLDEARDPVWPPDHELLAAAAGGRQAASEVTPYTFGRPVSPHYAAQLAGEPIDPRRIRAAADSAARGADALVCEGVGGLLVPIAPGYSVRDLAVELALPVLVVARSGLGTINHALLTVEAVRARALEVAGIVMSPWPERPEPIEQSNRATIEELTGVRVSGLPPTTPSRLASAGDTLPLEGWV